jgi:hypothetical protein
MVLSNEFFIRPNKTNNVVTTYKITIIINNKHVLTQDGNNKLIIDLSQPGISKHLGINNNYYQIILLR